MSWLLWRQHRSQAVVIGIALILFAVAVLITGLHMAHVYNDAIGVCRANGTCDLVGNLFSGYGAIIDTIHVTIALPLLFGAMAATLIARETEHTTNVLAWTQTVTRRRWTFAKVGTALGATLLTSAAVAALVTWWSATPNSLNGNRFEGAQFDTQNIVPIAFALFAVALGLAAGSVLRRTLPALATTVGVYAGVRILVAVYLRPHYMKAVTAFIALTGNTGVASGSWTVSQRMVDGSGRDVSNQRIPVPAACNSSSNGNAIQKCLGRLGYRNAVTYHPPSQYWSFQWIEFGIFVALAAGLVAIAITYTLRHDA